MSTPTSCDVFVTQESPAVKLSLLPGKQPQDQNLRGQAGKLKGFMMKSRLFGVKDKFFSKYTKKDQGEVSLRTVSGKKHKNRRSAGIAEYVLDTDTVSMEVMIQYTLM